MPIEPDRPMRRRSSPSTASRLAHRKSGARVGRSPVAARSALELRALQAFRMIFGSARRFDADIRRTTGISGSLLWALAEIARTASISVTALAERMALHQTTASNIINALVERKLVRRARSSADQRVVRLSISLQGVRVLRHAPGPHAGLLVDALTRLEEGQIEVLQKSLAILVAQMRATAAIAAGETLLGE
jgi:DNA-binding MarR family transcriptional regulator